MKRIIAASIFLMLTCRVLADIVPTPGSESVPHLFDASALVFSGEVVSVAAAGESDSTWKGRRVRLRFFTALAVPDRQYKGELSKTTVTIVYSRPVGNVCAVSKCENLARGEYGLFFLAKQDATYHLADPFFGKFAVSRLKATEHGSGLSSMQADLVAGLRDADEKLLLNNIELLGALESVSSAPPLLELLPSNSSQTVHAAVFAALLRLHYYGKLKDSLSLLESQVQTPAESVIREQTLDLVSEILDSATSETLIAFAQSASEGVRQAVIHALREMASAQAVPIFVAALDDQLELIRYDAVLGLAAVEQNWDLAPSLDAFETNESKYIGAWKSWWIQSGKEAFR